MAFAGIHAMVSEVRAINGSAPLPSEILFAKTITAAGALGQVPLGRAGSSDALLRCEAAADGYVASSTTSAAEALSRSADANANRRLVRTGQPYDFWVKRGAYLAWTPA